MKPIRDMRTSIIYVYEHKVMTAVSRYTTSKYDPSNGKLLEIIIVLHDDDNNVVDRHSYKVIREEDSNGGKGTSTD